jgi:superoxide dismutase
VLTTPDADLPMVYRAKALFTADLWEHAYYLDHHNERAKYLQAFIDHLVDWDFAAANWSGSEREDARRTSKRAVRALPRRNPSRR